MSSCSLEARAKLHHSTNSDPCLGVWPVTKSRRRESGLQILQIARENLPTLPLTSVASFLPLLPYLFPLLLGGLGAFALTPGPLAKPETNPAMSPLGRKRGRPGA